MRRVVCETVEPHLLDIDRSAGQVVCAPCDATVGEAGHFDVGECRGEAVDVRIDESAVRIVQFGVEALLGSSRWHCP